MRGRQIVSLGGRTQYAPSAQNQTTMRPAVTHYMEWANDLTYLKKKANLDFLLFLYFEV